MRKICIETYGCAFNHQDSEIMAGLLKSAGFDIVENEADAEVVIINSCTVKNSSETKFFAHISRLKSEGKIVIAAGCIPQAESSYSNSKLLGVPIIGINEFDKVVSIVIDAISGKITQELSVLSSEARDLVRTKKEEIRFFSPKLRKNNLIEILPINEGCLGNCSFCKTKFARGNLFSYTIPAIKHRFEVAVNSGVKEIFLTSQDVACYGFDIGTNLVKLLKELLKVSGSYRIRIGMGNPEHFSRIIDDLLEVMKDERVYKFLHIPVQSGSNRILKEMNRPYTREGFLELVNKIRKKIPEITISTDIIVAFPTESREEFLETLELVKLAKVSVLNFSRFWLRKGTLAEKYSKSVFIDGKESKLRSIETREFFEKFALEQNNVFIGRVFECLICEEGKEDTETFIVRNDTYLHIIVPKKKGLKLGDRIRVKIISATWCDLRGEILDK